ncbi:MAG: DUF3421 domain-containing protein [Rhodocyclales bacterium]|nr:DUF3421 domain-containing protein [Rhodocyclales bacterium]
MTYGNFKPALAIAASLGVMAAVGEAAAADPLTWSKGTVPANAVIAAGTKANPVYICRMQMADKAMHPGKAGPKYCYVSYGGKEIKKPLAEAEVLASSAPTGWADVKGGQVPASALKAGEAGGVPMHFCRAKHDGKDYHAGKEWKGSCYYGYGGKEIKAAEFQVMGLTKVAAAPTAAPAPATPPAPTGATRAPAPAASAPAAQPSPAAAAPAKPAAAAPSAADPLTWSKGKVPANAVVSAGSKDQPMYICRMPMADKAMHPGKAGPQNCYVSYGGKEIKKPLAEAEVLASSAPTGWADVKGGQVPASALKAGEVGGVTMHFCRAKHEGKEYHAGKEWKGSCYYGYGGKEIKAAEFQVMGLMKVAAAPTGAPAQPTAPAAAPAKPAAPAAAPSTPAKPAALPAPGVVPNGGIQVEAANYGANCPKHDKKKNAAVAPSIAKACNGKQTCDYKIDVAVLGDTAPGCAKEAVVIFSCPPFQAPRPVGVAKEAHGKIVKLVCPPAPKK